MRGGEGHGTGGPTVTSQERDGNKKGVLPHGEKGKTSGGTAGLRTLIILPQRLTMRLWIGQGWQAEAPGGSAGGSACPILHKAEPYATLHSEQGQMRRKCS